MEETLRDKLIASMRELFGEDRRRIDHTLTVLAHAEAISESEPGSARVVVAAAILHDIGIPASEAKHGSSAAKYQETEGPPIAEEILRRLGVDGATIEHVCRIIANHHTARDIDTPEFRIVWDADWLVNLPGATGGKPETLREKIDAVFKTSTGKARAEDLYLERTD